MRDPQWAISRLREMADRVETEYKEPTSSIAATVLRGRANRISNLSSELAAALTESAKLVEEVSREVNGQRLVSQEEARDYSDGIFDQRSYR